MQAEGASEVAELRQRIAAECDAGWQALHGLASGTTQHELIVARLKNMEACHTRLVELVGDERATEILCEVYTASEEGKRTEMNNDIFLELLETLQQKSDVSSITDNSWKNYASILRYVDKVCLRVPSLAALEACNEADMDLILIAELEHLASLVAEIFPGRGAQELGYYLQTPTT